MSWLLLICTNSNLYGRLFVYLKKKADTNAYVIAMQKKTFTMSGKSAELLTYAN